MNTEHGIGVDIRATTNVLAADLKQAEQQVKAGAQQIERAAMVQLRVDPAAAQAAVARRQAEMMARLAPTPQQPAFVQMGDTDARVFEEVKRRSMAMQQMMTQQLPPRVIQPMIALDEVRRHSEKVASEREKAERVVNTRVADDFGKQMQRAQRLARMAAGGFIALGVGEAGIGIGRLARGDIEGSLEAFKRIPIFGQLTDLGHRLHDEFLGAADIFKQAVKEMARDIREAGRAFARDAQAIVRQGVLRQADLADELALASERDPNKRDRLRIQQEFARRRREAQDRADAVADSVARELHAIPAKGFNATAAERSLHGIAKDAEVSIRDARAILQERIEDARRRFFEAQEQFRGADGNRTIAQNAAARSNAALTELREAEEALRQLNEATKGATSGLDAQKDAAQKAADAERQLLTQIESAQLERMNQGPIIDTIQTVLGTAKFAQPKGEPATENTQKEMAKSLRSVDKKLSMGATVVAFA